MRAEAAPPAAAVSAGAAAAERISLRSLAPSGLAVVLLLLATVYDGAYDVRHWAPVAIFALVALAAYVLRGGAPPLDRASAVALACIWAFAAWTLLSAAWSEAPGRAIEGGARTTLYAALVSLALVAVPGQREARKLGALAIGGVTAIAAVVLVRLNLDGAELVVAGRLDAPTGYRNATACLFALPFWPLLGVAASKARNPSLRALTFSAAVMTLGLAFLTQSRGALVGLLVGGLVALVVGPEWIRRPWLAALAAFGLIVLSGPLLAAHRNFDSGVGATAGDVAGAGGALTFLVFDALIVGVLFALLDGGLRASPENMRRAKRIAVAGLVVGALGLVGAGMAASGNPIEFAEQKLEQFSRVETRAPEIARFVSTGGERYDLWRVAAEQFAAHPIAGAGEGSYAPAYYRDRASARNLTEPHSLPLRLLAETGLVGLLLVGTAVGALLWAVLRASRGASLPARRAAAGLAGAGMVVVGQSLVDWVWPVPAVMGLGLFCLALAATAIVPRPIRAREHARRGPPLRLWARALCAAGLGAAAAVVLALYLADLRVGAARAELASSPGAALADARAAASIAPWSVTPLHLEASAYERLGDRPAARATLRRAIALEPGSFVTHGLVGDLELRAGDRRAAHRAYRAAARLNPRDPGLKRLVQRTRPEGRALHDLVIDRGASGSAADARRQ